MDIVNPSLLMPHELAKILGWSIKRVLHLLGEGKIPAQLVKYKKKIRFRTSPLDFAEWVYNAKLRIRPEQRKFLDMKVAQERHNLGRMVH
jgi:hypothetical protein